MEQVLSLFGVHLWLGYLTRSLQALLLAVPVALLFEVGGWLSRRWVLARLQPAFSRGGQREPLERARRKRALRDLTISGLRWLQNLLAIIVILSLWGLNPVVPTLLACGGVALAWGPLRDVVSGYVMLLDDSLAPGDEVVLNGKLAGVVSDCGPRRVKLSDGAGRNVLIAWSDIKAVESRVPDVAPRPAEGS